MPLNRRSALFGAAALAAGPAAAARAPRTYTLTMARMRFAPAPAGLRVGDAIVWVNDDPVRHTATARNGDFDVDLAPKARGRTVLRRAGTIAYYCRFHPAMRGTLTVAA